MKNLKSYIIESIESTEEVLVNSLKGISLTKPQVEEMLSKMDMRRLKKLSEYIKTSEYSKDYFVYEPNKDLFISPSNKDDIIQVMSDFIYKYICSDKQ